MKTKNSLEVNDINDKEDDFDDAEDDHCQWRWEELHLTLVCTI